MTAVLLLALLASKPLFGIAPNVTDGGGFDELVKNVMELRTMGCDFIPQNNKWSEIDSGKPDLRKFEENLKGSKGIGFSVAYTLRTLDTNQRNLPKDLEKKALDDPEVLSRLEKLISQMVPKLTDNVFAFSIGNEVDIYLRAHPEEIEAWFKLQKVAVAAIKKAKPGLPVGVTVTFEGLQKDPKLAARLMEGMDVAFYTYYPLDAKPAELAKRVPADFAAMAAAAGKRPLIFQEVGYPASEKFGSSEAAQAQFVDLTFDALAKHGDRTLAASYFLLIDFSPSLVETLLGYYGLQDVAFKEFLSTLGLKRSDGTPRKAWGRMQERLKLRLAHEPS